MVKFAKNNSDVGIVGGVFLDEEGNLQRNYRRFPTVSTAFFCYTRLGQIIDHFLFHFKFDDFYKLKDIDFSLIVSVDQIGASCLLIPRDVIEKIGGLFDEDFPILFNDVDLCKRVWKAGYKVVVLPEARIIHIGNQSLKKLSRHKFLFYQNKGIIQYYKKHENVINTFLVYAIIFFRKATDSFFDFLRKEWVKIRERLKIRK